MSEIRGGVSEIRGGVSEIRGISHFIRVFHFVRESSFGVVGSARVILVWCIRESSLGGMGSARVILVLTEIGVKRSDSRRIHAYFWESCPEVTERKIHPSGGTRDISALDGDRCQEKRFASDSCVSLGVLPGSDGAKYARAAGRRIFLHIGLLSGSSGCLCASPVQGCGSFFLVFLCPFPRKSRHKI